MCQAPSSVRLLLDLGQYVLHEAKQDSVWYSVRFVLLEFGINLLLCLKNKLYLYSARVPMMLTALPGCVSRTPKHTKYSWYERPGYDLHTRTCLYFITDRHVTNCNICPGLQMTYKKLFSPYVTSDVTAEMSIWNVRKWSNILNASFDNIIIYFICGLMSNYGRSSVW